MTCTVIDKGSIVLHSNPHMCYWQKKIDFGEYFNHPLGPNDVIMSNSQRWMNTLNYTDEINFKECTHERDVKDPGKPPPHSQPLSICSIVYG
jgi:hypothetical protein